MPIFEYACRECNVSWEREGAIGKAPKRTKCASCGKYGFRYYGNQIPAISFGSDTDFHTVRASNKRYQEKGMDKTSADKFLRDSMERSEKHTNEGWKHYAKYTVNPEVAVKQGKAKRRTQEETDKAKDTARNLTAQVYNNLHKDPSKLDFNKPK